ncbi:MAG: trehalose-phosphatase [Phycisphaerales bacterium]
MTPELRERLRQAASAPVLLVGSDYDGTLSPIVERPEDARPLRESIVALTALAEMPQTHVAVISGRALRQLAEMTGLSEAVHLVGSHGSEFDPDFAARLTPSQQELLARLTTELEVIAEQIPGATIETKPASVAFHYRNAEASQHDHAVHKVERGPAAIEGVIVKRGKMVIELAVTPVSKGKALTRIRHRVGATAAVFIGDDITDEDAFETLSGPDVAVKVGDEESIAEFRVKTVEDVAKLLAELSELRQEWLTGCAATPIEQLSFLSDSRTNALVSPDGNVVWLCAPRADSASLFAYLLGGDAGGWYSVRPANASAQPIEQRYIGDSLVLETRWRDMTVTDYMDASAGRPSQRAGRVDLLRVLEGTGEARVEFAPRLDYGRERTLMRTIEGGVAIDDTNELVTLLAPDVEWTIERRGASDVAVGTVSLRQGKPVLLEMRFGAGPGNNTRDEGERREQTRRWWASWASSLRLPQVEPELVRRSALTLKGLCYGPTGAILAAATTSLPEHVGGVRNWDYRYCWLRDAAMSASALVQLGSAAEAMRFADWILDVVEDAQSPERLNPLYTVTGHELGPEAAIAELAGYRGSRPVRVGNAAARQVQLDVFGPVVDLIWRLSEFGAPISSEHWRLVEAMVLAVQRRWNEPDHGIWEVRGPRRHHLFSRLQCWVAADRGVKIAERFLGKSRPDWAELRDAIAKDVHDHGWSEQLGAYPAAYDLHEADAAVLPMGLCGLIDPRDDRFVRTVEVIERELRLGPAVYRYRYDDGLPGPEGAFHLCTSWLIRSYLAVGRKDDAWALFREMVALAGPTGLLPEQYGPKTKRSLGNHPQAFSHLGLIEAAAALADAG